MVYSIQFFSFAVVSTFSTSSRLFILKFCCQNMLNMLLIIIKLFIYFSRIKVFLTYIIVLKSAGCQLPSYNLSSTYSCVNSWGFREWTPYTLGNISYCGAFKSLFRQFFFFSSSLKSLSIHFVYQFITLAFTRCVIKGALWQWTSPRLKP